MKTEYESLGRNITNWIHKLQLHFRTATAKSLGIHEYFQKWTMREDASYQYQRQLIKHKRRGDSPLHPQKYIGAPTSQELRDELDFHDLTIEADRETFRKDWFQLPPSGRGGDA